jgi:hypothetical protein
MPCVKSGIEDNESITTKGVQDEELCFLFFNYFICAVVDHRLWRWNSNESNALLRNRFGL